MSVRFWPGIGRVEKGFLQKFIACGDGITDFYSSTPKIKFNQAQPLVYSNHYS
jgi:hypothetical protein